MGIGLSIANGLVAVPGTGSGGATGSAGPTGPTGPTGSGGTPGGASTSVQYNNSGVFGGFGAWDGATLTVAQQITSAGTIGWQKTGLGFDGAATIDYGYAWETPTSYGGIGPFDAAGSAGGLALLGASDGTNAGVMISGILSGTASAGVPSVLIIGAGPATSSSGTAQNALVFAVNNDYGPNMLTTMELCGGFTDSVGAIGINTDTPGAVLHVTHRVPGTLHGYDPTAEIVVLVEGIATQAANLQSWKLTGGSVLASVSPTGKITGASFSVGATAGIDTTITTGTLVGKTVTVTKGLITGFA